MKTIEFVAGLTIKEALESAAAKREPVLADVNDIIIPVKPGDRIENLLESYLDKLNFKYEIEKIKREKQRCR